MPAKGWRKDEQESNMETALANQKIPIDNILFPKSTVVKVAKSVLQGDTPGETPMILAQESQTVIQRSAVVFVNYIYHNAKQYIKQKGRKVVTAEDILVALETTNFNGFVPVLREELDNFNRRKEAKKKEKEQSQTDSVDAVVEKETAEAGELAGQLANKRLKMDGNDSATTEETIAESGHSDSTISTDNENENGQTDEEEEEEGEVGPSPALQLSQQMQAQQKELEGEQMDETTETNEEDED